MGEQDDLIAMAFIDTLTSLQESLSPLNRASPTTSNNKVPLNTDELFKKINTLRNCVEHLQVFQPALSDHDHSEHNVISFDAHYAKTFETEKKEIEHGKLSDITHTKHCAVKPITMSLSKSTS